MSSDRLVHTIHYAPSERQSRVSLVQTCKDILLPAKFLIPEQSGCADVEKEVYADGVLDDFLPKYQLEVISSCVKGHELMPYHGR